MNNLNFIIFARCLAILMVCGVHVAHITVPKTEIMFYFFNFGQVGVQIFFFISGFLLTRNYILKNYKIKFFYIKRIFRIFPLYLIGGIIFYYLWTIAKYYYVNNIFVFNIYNIEDLIINIFLLNGFFSSANNNIVPGGWSIGTEVYFYILFPVVIFFLKKITFKIFIIFFFIIFIFYNKLLIIIDPLILNRTLIQIIFFISGGLLFLNIKKIKNTLKSNKFKIFFIIFLSIILISISKIIFPNNTYMDNYNFNYIIFIFFLNLLIFFLILFLSNYNFKNKYHSIFLNVGNNSYSIYIFHFFILDIINYFFVKKFYFEKSIFLFFLVYIFTIVITFLISILTVKYIEKYGINIGNKLIEILKKNEK